MSTSTDITALLRTYDAARKAERTATTEHRAAAARAVDAADRAIARYYAAEREAYGSQAEATAPRGRTVRLGGSLDI